MGLFRAKFSIFFSGDRMPEKPCLSHGLRIWKSVAAHGFLLQVQLQSQVGIANGKRFELSKLLRDGTVRMFSDVLRMDS